MGSAKLKDVTELVYKLKSNLESDSLSSQECTGALEKLKIHGRDPRDAEPIFTEDGITMLLRYGLDGPPSETSRAALKVLANAMLLKPDTRSIFVDQDFAPKACQKLRTNSWDDEFLISRILFFSTYGTNVDLSTLIEQHRLADHIIENITRHVNLLDDASQAPAGPMEEMALVETLKLTFNVTHFHPESIHSFTPAISLLVRLLWRQDDLPTRPLDPPYGQLVNSLLNLDLAADKSQEGLFLESDPNKVTTRLLQMLERSMGTYDDEELDTVVTPIVSLLCKINENAPEAVQQHIREALLPAAEDRETILGRGNTLSAQLLKNSTNPVAPHLRDAISHLFFDMSDRDASKFVENVGYGYASGFLFQQNIPVPESASETFTTDTGGGTQKPVNPITGQFLDRETEVDLPDMTEEEKEREAEKLFVLIERLKKTGIIDVQNPVEEAIREGRFRELGDDDVEELE